MRAPEADTRFTSFDGTTQIQTRARRPDRYAYWDRRDAGEVTIPRGAGLSYAAASFGGGAVSVEHRLFDRILAFDPDAETVEVEAGVTLGDLYQFLTPRGFYVPVQPGHPSISIGGCAAPDVHGKNQFRDGTFIDIVRAAKLFHPRHGIVEVRPGHELFRLTFGGYGLTGNILSLTIAVKPLPTSWVRITTLPLEDITRLPQTLKESAARADLVFSWHSFTARGRGFGRGFVKEGSFTTGVRDGSGAVSVRELTSESRGGWRAPFFGSLTTPMFNRIYGTASRVAAAPKLIPLYDFLFPVHDKLAYFKLFGRRGFHEYQLIIPFDRYAEWIDRVRHRLAKHPLPITLASAKLFSGRTDLLRFTGEGVCFALDFPHAPGAAEFAALLDETCIALGCLPNIIKDSRLSADVVARTYPGYESFRAELRRFDPERVYRSELSERLGL